MELKSCSSLRAVILLQSPFYDPQAESSTYSVMEAGRSSLGSVANWGGVVHMKSSSQFFQQKSRKGPKRPKRKGRKNKTVSFIPS